jgi:predicted CoA-binding protein
MLKKTLVLGASLKPVRYSNLAIRRLVEKGHSVVAVGRRTGIVEGVEILTGMPELNDIDTITVYLNEDNQKPFENYILGLKPRRIIFNPGAENPRLKKLAVEKGIEVNDACTLVMLSVGSYGLPEEK